MAVEIPLLADAIERSADPAAVRSALVPLDRRGDLGERLAASPGFGARLVAVLAASRSLTRLLLADPVALEVLSDDPPPLDLPPADRPFDEVVAWKRRTLLRIAAHDLTGRDDLEQVTDALSELAAGVLRAAADRVAGPSLAVVGMGKLGAGELNYASDVDVVFVGDGPADGLERAARQVLTMAGRCFRVDANLRPEGRDGPLVRSLESYQQYWARWAEPWERQALLKARPLAGDVALGDRWHAAAQEVVWGRPFGADALHQVRDLKARTEQLLRRRDLADREIKRGPGGIRDVEFAIQLLQLVHGGADPDLRARASLAALQALADGGYVDPADAADLGRGYRELRRIEHALQLVDEQQTHVVPAERVARRHIARVLGYRGSPEAGPTEAFDRDLASLRTRIRQVHERVWFRPLLDSFAGAGTLTPEAAAARLSAFGFADAERTRQAVVELTRGLTRSSRLMQQLLPVLLDWLSGSPDPDLGLLGLRKLATGEQRSMELATAFRDSPEVARQLARLLGTSAQLGEVLALNPDLIDRLPDPARLVTRPRPDLIASARATLRWRTDEDERDRAMKRWTSRHLLGIAARDVLHDAGVEEVGADLARLAEAVLDVALAELEPAVPFAVVALGRFSGWELAYASDLDIVFVHEGDSPGDHEEAERVASGLHRFVGGETPAVRLWSVDTTLRPEGRQGPLSRSLEAWETYLDRWAQTWERQAYLRARGVAGDLALAGRLVARMSEAVHDRPFSDAEVREVRRMKARIEHERIPSGEDPQFHLKLGSGSLSDIEFTVQLLQLVHQVPGSATIPTIRRLAELGHLDPEEAATLAQAYRFCERTRNRLFLVVGAGDSLPTRPERLGPLARSLEVTASGLRDEYRRVTRRARRVVERRFYGRD
ncbi:MAG: bifunctional [glutamine synthetase] adenylyltransferase/[glutamine synthetase]-adenylyl-L-tyrosine phosphorylase [Acidimicrobiia bacterium]